MNWYNLWLNSSTDSNIHSCDRCSLNGNVLKSMHGIPVYSGVGGGVVNGYKLGDVSRGLESPMRGKVPGEMENSCNLKF